MALIFAPRKPRKCPRCGAAPVASILFGMPNMTPELKQKITEGKIILGGCCMEVSAPMWQCAACKTDIFHERDRMNLDKNG